MIRTYSFKVVTQFEGYSRTYCIDWCRFNNDSFNRVLDANEVLHEFFLYNLNVPHSISIYSRQKERRANPNRVSVNLNSQERIAGGAECYHGATKRTTTQ